MEYNRRPTNAGRGQNKNVRRPGKKERTRQQRNRRRIIVGGSVAAAVCVVFAGAFAYTRSPNGGSGTTFIQKITQTFTGFQQPFNILLIGNNARNPQGPLDIGSGGGGQADIMMLAHVDPKAKTVELISIPRDMLFAMPQYNVSIPKIKSLFFIGAQMNPNQAAQLTVQGVEKFTGMKINYWVATDFQGFADAINAVGGVRVDVPGRIYDPLHSGANLYPGWQTLNGSQALAYIRTRQNQASSADANDFERDNSQAQVLSALQQKLLSGSTDTSHIRALVQTWTKDVATNMSLSDLVNAARAARGAKVSHMNLANVGDSMDIMSTPYPGINQQNYLTGAYYDVVDPYEVAKKLKPFGSTGSWTGVPLPRPTSITVDLYGSQAYAQKLEQAGYHVNVLGSSGTYPVQIDYPPGDLGWGLQVGRTLATGNGVVQQGSSSGAVVVSAP